MLKLLKPANPEDLFVQRYDLLMGWALSLTAHNQALAQDLVHDAFIQFTLRRAELGAIENTDAYLHRMLRNMHLSQVRRAALIEDSRFSIGNFDSAELGLRAVDPREDVTVQDELRLICQYACARKDTSKAGSVLILRFFHSYYPSEIARVLRTNRTAVDRWLALARREAKNYLVDPNALRFTTENPPSTTGELGYARTTVELLNELHQTIFDSRKGDCLSVDELEDIYSAKTTVDGAVLAHVVSCPNCLDEVNRLLGLPLLAERNADDRLGRDKDVPPDSSGGDGAGGGGSLVESKRRYQRRFKEMIEHRPQELRIAVNGFVLGAQQVSSEFNKQALAVNVDEPIGFIEVFSEQGVRLLFLDVDQPTDGNIEQTASAEFDCGRKLELSLNFRGPWPALNVAYRDPTFVSAEELQNITEDDETFAVAEEAWTFPGTPVGFAGRVSQGAQQSIKSLRSVLFGGAFWARPATVTILLAVLLMVAFFALRRSPVTPLTATQLLDQAVRQEEMLAARTDQVLHRTISLEERRVAQSSNGAQTPACVDCPGELLARHRIEVWQSAEKGITARRLYDENGALVAGDWRRSDGVQTIYHHGARPQLKPAPDKRPATSVSFDQVWQLSPSAKEFTSLVANAGPALVEERSNAYVLSAESASSVSTGSGSDRVPVSLIRATLTLSKSDLHPIEETLLITQGSETREYHFLETSFDRRPPSAVAPAVFEPEAELLSSAKPVTPDSKLETPSSLPLTPYPFMATAELEVEVLRLLSQAGADLGEQISVTRTSNGLLSVQGIVDTEKRKGEILRALSSVSSNPAVRVDVKSVAEALRGQKPDRQGGRGVRQSKMWSRPAM